MDLGLTHGIGQLLTYAYSFDVREKPVEPQRPISPSSMVTGEPTLDMLRKLARCMKQAEEEKDVQQMAGILADLRDHNKSRKRKATYIAGGSSSSTITAPQTTNPNSSPPGSDSISSQPSNPSLTPTRNQDRSTSTSKTLGKKSQIGYKPKKKRRRLTNEQLATLESIFDKDTMPSTQVRNQLADNLDMTPRSVQIWFQNKRAKLKRNSQNPGAKEEKKDGKDDDEMEIDEDGADEEGTGGEEERGGTNGTGGTGGTREKEVKEEGEETEEKEKQDEEIKKRRMVTTNLTVNMLNNGAPPTGTTTTVLSAPQPQTPLLSIIKEEKN
eukprot:TRINITY_DN7217_c0_g1_i1.p1 TRINITY_DN7217_c0_g1~~TRINITY_DN7217_c0_g1_i1.p1  ORF type:complete len:326 (+),score=111.98 TRINITY_DN7217_c0_g1_i1:157-1134(+)